METDRWAILTLRAAARGVIDFGRCDPLSKRWWDRVTHVLNALAREDDIVVYDAALRFQLALLGCPHVGEDKVKEIIERAEELTRNLLGAVQPWMAKSSASAQEETINALVSLYKEKCGDPKDPKFMRALRESIAMRAKDREQKKASSQLSQDQLLDRRLAERDRRMKNQPPVRMPRRGRT